MGSTHPEMTGQGEPTGRKERRCDDWRKPDILCDPAGKAGEDREVVMLRKSAVVSIALLALAGCGGGDDQPQRVTGRVLYRGAPLAGGTIVFAPDPEKGAEGSIAWGEIAKDGRYSLRTDAGEGVKPGWHRVTFAASAGQTLPANYSDPAKSGKTCEVKAGQTNEFDFDLK
jgi:hypothetical protein